MGEGDGLVQHDRLLEQPLDEVDVALGGRHAQAAERAPHLLEQVLAVAVVRLTADALGLPADDPLIAGVHIRPVVLAGRRDHPEGVVDLHPALGRLRRRHHDRGPAARGARLHDQARASPALDVAHEPGQDPEVPLVEIGQLLLAHAPDGQLDLLRQLVGRSVELRPGAGELGAGLAEPPADRPELARALAQLRLGVRRDPAAHAPDGTSKPLPERPASGFGHEIDRIPLEDRTAVAVGGAVYPRRPCRLGSYVLRSFV